MQPHFVVSWMAFCNPPEFGRVWRAWGACSPEKILKNDTIWCVLENIFAKILSKKIVKIFIFHIKLIDNVLLRTLFRGIGAYSPDFL